MGRNDRATQPRGVVVSKTLSRVLRHSAPQEKIELTPQGYAKVSDLLKWHKAKSLKITFQEILDSVVENNKQRFALLYTADGGKELKSDNFGDDIKDLSLDSQKTSTQVALEKAKVDQDPRHYLIRATQGHSIKTIDSADYLEPITLDKPDSIPDTVVHGTYHAAWPLIMTTGGLKPMSRVHAHFAIGPTLSEIMPDGIDGPVKPRSGTVPGQGNQVVISGMRTDAQILIYINIKKALESGVPFWTSENCVILSEGRETGGRKVIGTEFFDVVVETKEKLGVLWRDGKQVKEVPEGLVKKGMPRGKTGHGHHGQKNNKGEKKGNQKPIVNIGNMIDVAEQ